MCAGSSGASDVQVQTLFAEAWGGSLEQRKPFLQLGWPEAEWKWGTGGPGLWPTPKRTGLQVWHSIYVHTQSLHPDSMAGAGGYGSGVGPSSKVLETEWAALWHPDWLEQGRDGSITWRGKGEAVEKGLWYNSTSNWWIPSVFPGNLQWPQVHHLWCAKRRPSQRREPEGGAGQAAAILEQ